MIEVPTDSLKTSQSIITISSEVPAPMQAVDSTRLSTLTTKVENGSMYVDLKMFDVKGESASFFDLTISNDNLPEDIRVVFGSVESMFEKCFKKKENYVVEGNGRITIKYSVKLQS